MNMDSQQTSGESGQGTEASPHWLESIPEDIKIEVNGDDGNATEIPLREHPKLGEFKEKDVTAFVQDYLNAQKLIGQKSGLKALPEDASDEDKAAWEKDMRQLLGVPENPEGYEISLPEGETRDEMMGDWFVNTAHELGMPPGMAQGLSDKFQEFGKSFWEQKLKADEQACSQALTKEYGSEDKAAEVSETAKKGFNELAPKAGLSAEDAEVCYLAYGNDPAFVKMFAFLGNSFKEHGLPDGGGGHGPGPKQGEMSTEDYLDDVFSGAKKG